MDEELSCFVTALGCLGASDNDTRQNAETSLTSLLAEQPPKLIELAARAALLPDAPEVIIKQALLMLKRPFALRSSFPEARLRAAWGRPECFNTTTRPPHG
jgi:hypothetical protein